MIDMNPYCLVPGEYGRAFWHDLFYVVKTGILGGSLAHHTHLANPLDGNLLVHARNLDLISFPL